MFDEVLSGVREAVTGMRAVLLADRDGMIVSRAGGEGEPALELIAVSYMDIARRLTAANREADLDGPRDLMVTGSFGSVAFHSVTAEYALIAVLEPDGLLGHARFELRRAGARVLPELEG